MILFWEAKYDAASAGVVSITDAMWLRITHTTRWPALRSRCVYCLINDTLMPYVLVGSPHLPHSIFLARHGTLTPAPCPSLGHRSQECGNIDKERGTEREREGGKVGKSSSSSTRARLLAPKETQKQKKRNRNCAVQTLLNISSLACWRFSLQQQQQQQSRQTTIGQKPKHNLNKFRKISSSRGRGSGEGRGRAGG